MLHWSTLGEERKALLKILVDNMPLPGSYLAGGTALALILGHRQSIDLDWFCADHFDPEQLAWQLSSLKTFETSDAAKGTLHGIFSGMRLTWLYYPNPLLDDFITTADMPALKLASLKDIAVMKLAALSHRGSAKDFVDLYVLAKHNISLRQINKSFRGQVLKYCFFLPTFKFLHCKTTPVTRAAKLRAMKSHFRKVKSGARWATTAVSAG